MRCQDVLNITVSVLLKIAGRRYIIKKDSDQIPSIDPVAQVGQGILACITRKSEYYNQKAKTRYVRNQCGTQNTVSRCTKPTAVLKLCYLRALGTDFSIQSPGHTVHPSTSPVRVLDKLACSDHLHSCLKKQGYCGRTCTGYRSPSLIPRSLGYSNRRKQSL